MLYKYMMMRYFLGLLFGMVLLGATCLQGMAEQKSGNKYSEVPRFFPKMKPVQTAVYVDIIRDSEEAKQISRVLQGIVNRDSAEVFLAGDQKEMDWLKVSGKPYRIPEETIREGKNPGLRTLFKLYKERIDKLVVCRFEDNDYTWNMGVMMAGVENVLPVSEELKEEFIQEFGWDKEIIDIRNRWQNRTEAYDWALTELMPRLDKTIVFSLGLRSDWRRMSWRLYDYAVATRSFVFWLDNHDEEGCRLIRKILNTPGYPRNSFVMGYGMFGDDLNDAINPEGFGFLVGDIFPNASFYSSFPTRGFEQPTGKDHKAQKNKIYVALHWSDGDNIQFNHNATWEIFHQKARGKTPVSMTLSPALMEIAPFILKYYYDQKTEKDEFIGGPSGFQYIQEPFYKKSDYISWCEQNGNWLGACGMHVTASSLRWPAQPFYNNGFKKSGVAGTFAWSNSSYQDAYNWLGMPVVCTGHNIAYEKELYDYLVQMQPCPDRPLFTSAYMIQAPFGGQGYAAINRVAQRLQKQFPGRFEFLLASDMMVTAKNYFESVQCPYRNLEVPGKLEAEDFDLGGQGAGFYDYTYKNEGGAYRNGVGDFVGIAKGASGYLVGWTAPGEWLNYTVKVSKSGKYLLNLNYAAAEDNRRLSLLSDDQVVMEAVLKATGGSGHFKNYECIVELPEGKHNLKLFFTDGGIDVDYFTFGEVPFLNTACSFEERVEDLVSRMTLEEKASQMQNISVAIDRLGIPAYDWWNECLHGVGRSGDKVTVFPQAIGMAATFDVPALQKMGEITSEEARAIHQQAIKEGKMGVQYKGLTFWTPNINIFRDPRWGRGQETYGEDPYLTGLMGAAIVRGLQGDDPKYLKVSACAKHYAVHSGPETGRHEFDVAVDAYELWDTYLPAFHELVVKAGVSSVMCAYNRYDGQPCCGSDQLMMTILRNLWGFQGYVTSDCGAIDDFYKHHKTHPDEYAASADAVIHGTDLDCGQVYKALVGAVKKGLIEEEQIDMSVKRLFMIRFRLGMFDPENQVSYAQIPYTILECEAHQAHALKMARESMVLLKNEKKCLPLSKSLNKIVVVGPNADDPEVQLGNYNGFPSHIVSPLEGIRSKTDAEVVYVKGSNYTTTEAGEMEKVMTAVKGADAVIYVGGISPRLEGEEGDAGREKLDGFRGGDRTNIALPAVQTEIMKKIKSAGLPLIFVSMSGSALGFEWEAQNADAILQAWYGGQAAGTAIADVLFGDYNPAGRLPVTFYKNDKDLPDFLDYSMDNRTYRYFKGEPLYSFGYGLSYSDFKYTDLQVPEQMDTRGQVRVKVRVKNRSKKAGDEVVQLYVSHVGTSVRKPIRALQGVRRIHLQPGETQEVSFDLTAENLSLVDESGRKVCSPGKVQIFVGGGQPGKEVRNQMRIMHIIGDEIDLSDK